MVDIQRKATISARTRAFNHECQFCKKNAEFEVCHITWWLMFYEVQLCKQHYLKWIKGEKLA